MLPRDIPTFFRSRDETLYGMLHEPATNPPLNTLPAVVFCSPFADEAEISQVVRVNFARYLSKNGFWVLRFDYAGCGDSTGSFEDTSLDTYVDDIHSAIKYVKQFTEGNISLFGLRLGATLAMMASIETSSIKSLLLWEPVLNLDRHIGNFVRKQVMARNALAGHPVESKSKIVRLLESGETVDILAYPLSSRCYFSFVSRGIDAEIEKSAISRLTICISKKKRSRKDLELLVAEKHRSLNYSTAMSYVEDKPFWNDPNDFIRELGFWHGHEILFSLSTKWLVDSHR